MRIGKYEGSDGTAGTAITFLLIGLGVGAALGLLLAPKPGRQLRKDLRRSYDDALETASEWTDEAKDRFEEVVEKGSDLADELRSKATERFVAAVVIGSVVDGR
jgi:gas vesicle protein